ncbi:bifunctional DNA primase/polymerase [Rubinisphaera sp.]|uniref:bifunctional DNA primase/polymerase n=1 Tax=Rubinisphaera sp. TaxID=2024857 RepID=UPI000C0D28AA|nr:bifunctional DNA primase/polymerase [Rubinisphaera sp.]MBV10066.1 hypothetical protein [Rubinisphaera sp.]HCS53783.1 hypothetical protein [Planctomycetaceae bacterium]|tara:strand:- start:2479 stop:5034 length:2556 start_codon:yes stop_codon:yes gene_type:complete
MSIIDTLQDLISFGFSIVPMHSVTEDGSCTCYKGANCKDKGKHPKTPNGVHDATKDIEKLKPYYEDNKICNIGIATGEPSGVWLLDDDDEDEERSKTLASSMPITWKVKSGSGKYHYYFKHYEDLVSSQKIKNLPCDCDVRSTGSIAILPTSKHVSGGSYEWIVHPSECELADAPDWLMKFIRTKAEDEQKYSKTKTANGESLRDSVFIVNENELVTRAKAYLNECEQAVEGKSGHNVTYRIVASVVELFGDLPDETLFDLLSDWNDANDPPWTEKELHHKLKEARKKTTTDKRVTVNEDVIDNEDEDEDEVTYSHELGNDAYHGLIGEIVNTIEPETEADPAGILLSLLTAAGNSIGNNPYFEVGSDRHHCNLFTAIVGSTASGKGQAWSIVNRLMKEADQDWSMNCIASGISSGEGFIERVSDPEQDEDGLQYLIPLQRCLCLNSEFARPIQAMRRENNTLSPILRSSWDCDILEVQTRGKSKLRASNAFISFLGQITPDELNKLLQDSVEMVNGFSNRFLWCFVTSTKLLPHGGNHSVLDGYGERLRMAIEKARTINRVIRSEEANQLWENVYSNLKRERKGAYGRATDRACPNIVRLSLIYAVVDGSMIIEIEHLKAALAVWDYCDKSAEMFFSKSKQLSKFEQRILDYVIDNEGCSKTDIRRALAVNKSADDLDSAIVVLVKRNKIIKRESVDGHIKTTRFYECNKNNDNNRLLPVVTTTTKTTITTEQLHVDENTKTTKTTNATKQNADPWNKVAEMVEWKNANGIDFVLNDDGLFWVSSSQTHLLNDELRNTITMNQDVVKKFVPSKATTATEAEAEEELTDEEFYSWAKSLEEYGNSLDRNKQ